MSSADRAAHIDGQLHVIIVSNTHALPAEYKCLATKPSNHLRMFAGFLALTTFSAPPQILAASCLLLPNSRNEEMMGDGFWCYCCRFVLNSKRVHVYTSAGLCCK